MNPLVAGLIIETVVIVMLLMLRWCEKSQAKEVVDDLLSELKHVTEQRNRIVQSYAAAIRATRSGRPDSDQVVDEFVATVRQIGGGP